MKISSCLNVVRERVGGRVIKAHKWRLCVKEPFSGFRYVKG